MFEGFANFLQGNGFVSNADLDRKKKQDQQNATLSQARGAVPFAQYDAATNSFTNKSQIAQANQNVKTLELPNIVNQFSPAQLFAAQQNPNAPWSIPLQTAAKQQKLLQGFQEKPKTALENYAAVSGNIPIWSLANRLGGFAAEGFGNLTGNKDLAERASNFRSQLDIGMSNDEINSLPEEQRNKLRALQTGINVTSPLDLVGVSGLIKAPIVAGVKQAAKDIAVGGIKNGLTDTTKTLLKQGLKQQGIAAGIGAAVGTAADPAIQAYINDGEIDWSQVPGSAATGALWGAGIPSEISAIRNSARRSVGNAINETTGSAEAVGGLTLAKQRLLQTADQIEKSASETPTSQLGKIDDGISSEAQAQAKRQAAQSQANQLRNQASLIQDEVPQTRPITTQDISNPEVPLVLKKGSNSAWENQNLLDDLDRQDSALHQAASDAIQNAERGPDGLLTERGKAQAQEAVDAWGRVLEQRKALQEAIDADTVAPTPDAPIAEVIDPVQPLDSPITAESRNIAQAATPVLPDAITAPVSEVDARLAANAEAQLQGTPGYSRENLDLYRGANDYNTAGESPDRAKYYADDPSYAETYGDVTNKKATGGVLTLDRDNYWDRMVSDKLAKTIAKYVPSDKWRNLTGAEQMELQAYTNNSLTPEQVSRLLQKPMPDVVKRAFNDLGIDYIRVPGSQFKSNSGSIGHQTEVIELPKPGDSPVRQPQTVRQASELTSYEGAPDRATVEEYMRRIANGDTLDPIITKRDSLGNLGIEDGKHRFQAYQESGVTDIPTIDGTPNPLNDIQAEGRQLIESANATLATEGKSIGDLVQKLARANESGIPAQLTAAEQTAFKQLNDAVNSAQETAMRSGLITPETGNISQYLPTGSKDNVLPTELGDIANQDFNYSKSRTNALSDDDLKAGGENAFLDYFMRGKGSEHLDDATIDAQNATRAEVIAREEMFNIPREGNKPDTLDITPETKVQMEEAAVDAAEARRAQINAERAQSVGDKKTFKEQAAIAQEKSLDSAAKNINALQASVKQRAELIKNSNLNAQQKKAQYSALFDHLESVIAKKTYIQPMVTSNVLGQVPGRVADQVSKAIASTTDSLTSLVSQAGARGSFKRGTGRSLQTDGRTLRKVVKDTDAYKTFNQDRFETKLNKRAGLGNPWTRGVTRLTQAGSRRRAPIKDTVSYFAAKAQSEGITKAEDISRYVTEAARTPEWNKVYGMFYSSRNRFSGVPSFLPDANGNLVMTQTPLDPLFNSIERGLQKAVDMIPGVAVSPAIRKNLKTAIRQATLGFPRVIANQGYQAINTAALGVPDLLRAAATKGTDDISRLKKAVLVKQGLEGLQTAGGAYALGGAMGAAGLVTGAYPEDPAEQQRWQDEGRQEYSVNIGGVWVDPFRYGGLAGLPLMVGGLIGSGKGGDLGGLAVDIGGALGQNFGVGALQDLTKFLSGDTPQGQTTSLAMNFASQFVPGLSELNSLANATDENQRDLKSQDWGQEFINRGINKIPFLRQTLDKKTDSFGNEMKNPGYGIAAVLPIQGGDTGVNSDPAQAEVSRLQSAGFDAYPKGVDGSANNYTLKDGDDTAIKLTDAQQKDLNNAIKSGKQGMVNTLVRSEAYQSASDEEKAKMLKSVYSTNSAGIASDWAKANGIENAKQDTKGIADSLDADKASALAVADAMDTDTRDKWLEDKGNAVNYNVGKYENAIANGTLTAKDDNLENSSSLHYKAIASQVNATLPYWTATLEEQYKNTSKKELLAMSPDNPVRQALLALDQARAGAGVSLKDGDHSASKYGSDGSGTGDKFSFASAKGANAEKSGFTDPNVKSGFNAPLVKPLAIGEASAKAKRKIGVKRGVSL